MLFGDRNIEQLILFSFPSLIELALVNPGFPYLITFADRWAKGAEAISETTKVTSLQLDVSVCNSFIINAL
jgi:hypothetical protein